MPMGGINPSILSGIDPSNPDQGGIKGLFGKAIAKAMTKPTAQNFAQRGLQEMVGSLESDRAGLKGLRNQAFTAGLTSEGREGRRMRGAAGSTVAQEFAGSPTTYGGALSSALRRTKARAKIQGQGEQQVATQGLRNRVEIAKWSRAREGELVNAMAKARNIREGVNIGVSDANMLDKASKYGMYGSILGGITAVASNKEGRDWVKGLFNKTKSGNTTGGGDNIDWDDFKG